MTMNVDSVRSRLPLVLLVDSVVGSRHTLWRALHRSFGVLEADSVASASTWLGRRPDIDAVVVHGDLPDGHGVELARDLIASHPAAERAVIVAATTLDFAVADSAGLTRVDLGDLRGVIDGLASWLSARNPGLARLLLRDADRLFA
jgi:response regulator RpfG family c-di-GMP phosphodiesterase